MIKRKSVDIKQELISVKPSLYQIVIQGELNESWSDWLGDVVFDLLARHDL